MSGISFSYGWMQGLKWYRLDLVFFSPSSTDCVFILKAGSLKNWPWLLQAFLLPVDQPRENASIA